jgi:hypothetical protein
MLTVASLAILLASITLALPTPWHHVMFARRKECSPSRQGRAPCGKTLRTNSIRPDRNATQAFGDTCGKIFELYC